MAKTTFNPCVCGHNYIEHAYSTQAPCTADSCACREFKPDEVAEKAAIDALSADADDLRDPDEEPEPVEEE
jgi:hypothetical protein